MNRRSTIDVLGVSLVSLRAHQYAATVGDLHLYATHRDAGTRDARWLLIASVGDARIMAAAVTLAAANDKLRDLMMSNSYIHRAVKTARRAA